MALDDHDQHFIGPIAQKALIEKDSKVLLVQYPATETAPSRWDLPGGRLNINETSYEGLQREVREEINAEIKIESILATGVNVGSAFTSFFVIYKASLVEPEKELVAEVGEIAHIEWHDKKDIFTLPFAGSNIFEALKSLLV